MITFKNELEEQTTDKIRGVLIDFHNLYLI